MLSVIPTKSNLKYSREFEVMYKRSISIFIILCTLNITSLFAQGQPLNDEQIKIRTLHSISSHELFDYIPNADSSIFRTWERSTIGRAHSRLQAEVGAAA